MRIRHTTSSGQEKIELQMTPMIDMVFQLIVFFVMSFRISSQEGDFNIKMPLAAPSAAAVSDLQLPPIRIRLTADATGQLTGVYLNEGALPFHPGARVPMLPLRERIVEIIGSDRGPGSVQEQAEVELDCDYGLHYAHTIDAITAVSGYPDPQTGGVVKLVEKIKFAPPRQAPPRQ
jgi:biopolymer transport protein ExbD